MNATQADWRSATYKDVSVWIPRPNGNAIDWKLRANHVTVVYALTRISSLMSWYAVIRLYLFQVESQEGFDSQMYSVSDDYF